MLDIYCDGGSWGGGGRVYPIRHYEEGPNLLSIMISGGIWIIFLLIIVTVLLKISSLV